MADTPYGLPERDIARLRKMLQAFEAGNFGGGASKYGGSVTNIDIVVVKVASNAAGGGKYNLTLMQPIPGTDGDIDPTGDLSVDDFGTAYEPTSPSIKFLGIYPPEVATSDHGLTVGSVYTAVIRRRQDGGQTTIGIILGGGGSLPVGEMMGMAYMMVSQNQSGWSFPFFGAFVG